MATLKSTPNSIVHVSEMKDGDVAEIQPSWSGYAGRIVQRVSDKLITIGEGELSRTDRIFKSQNSSQRHYH